MALRCPKCSATLTPAAGKDETSVVCPGCDRLLDLVLFPALWQARGSGAAAEAILTADECPCFYHPGKRAVRACERCGRFLCALCEVDLAGEFLCPSCIQGGKRKGRLERLENERFRYDRVALALAVYPMIFFYVTLITAPAAIFIALRFWRRPGGLVRSGKWFFVVALVLATLQLAGWVLFFGFLIARAYK